MQSPAVTSRADIQGLRMVAVLLVIAAHLLDWPRGGFVGVDVFFVISGFLITGSLLHRIDGGSGVFGWFYRRRVRRIVPAATLVLVVTAIAAAPVLADSAYRSLLVDSVWALFFASNWRFAAQGTDYFAAFQQPSAVQHYWSLSVEEQFYVVWPALLVLVGLIAARYSSISRQKLTVAVVGTVVVGSFAYAVSENADNAAWAYFSTFARVWELAIGALVAVGAATSSRIPKTLASVIAWFGLLLVILGVAVLSVGHTAAAAPWKLALPVVGTAMVLGGGIRGTPKFFAPLTSRVAVYLGDISYSLYLWHFPVIVLLAFLIDDGPAYYVAALLLIFGLSVASYHLVEDPIRSSNWLEQTTTARPAPAQSKAGRAAVGALVAVVCGASVAAVARHSEEAPEAIEASSASEYESAGPASDLLTSQIAAALTATDWPDLSPSMDAAIAGPPAPDGVAQCSQIPAPPIEECTWGPDSATKTMMIVGDSVAVTYVETLKTIAEQSGSDWRLSTKAAFGCRLPDVPLVGPNRELTASCPRQRAEVVAAINELKPDLLIIADSYQQAWNSSTNRPLSVADWVPGMTMVVAQVADNVGEIVFLAPPPIAADVAKCYSKLARPGDCAAGILPQWQDFAAAEATMADDLGAAFVDSRAWFCAGADRCPSFVGTTPVKLDLVHMTPEYAALIAPAVQERLAASGLLD
ncbi:acyltransferase family protein [Antrihabitans sp. YC2-6]|uniref:acyltransferase family protein n=1 Tax=Antrihabitans sp. YC2-6 TaxID=2799498 RepID=UPI0018F40AA0|nr:acyltransferase family protein [Antrihabitans sp. YC2-6]MBJ8348971.1 acyltransferase [Antrihabitans sp. YC2-6]